MKQDLDTLKIVTEENLRKIIPELTKGVLIVGCDKETKSEIKRYFIVDDDWIFE